MPKPGRPVEAQGKPARFGPVKFPAIPYPEPVRIPTPAEGGDGRARDATATAPGGVRGEIPGGVPAFTGKG